MEGPTHQYMLAAPGCWHLHGVLSAGAHRRSQLSVDGYAVQHPGEPGPRSSQSVCVHLINLCRTLERGGPIEDGPRFLQGLTHRHYPWLRPPRGPYPITIVDLVAAVEPASYAAAERDFAQTAWAAWSAHHSTIRRWLDDPTALPRARSR